MAHFPKPFYRTERKRWYLQLDGKQYNLGQDKADAFRRYHQLMQAPKPVASKLVVGVIDGFLEWTREHRSPRTYEWYRDHLQDFVDLLTDKEIQTEKLRPFHVQQWADSHATWGDTYKRGAIMAVQRAFRWAEKLGHIERTPIPHIEKPKAQRRDNPITPTDFDKLLSHVNDRPFRDLLNFAWETGCRPQEARIIEPRHVNLDRARIELPPEEAKGKRRWRIIYLNDKAVEIVKRLLRFRKTGVLFRNIDGNPWTCDAIGCRFGRLSEKIGKRYAAYDIRHAFCQRLLENGTDHIAVAALLGHQDASMVSKVYSHMSRAEDHLRDQLNRATG